MKKVFGSFNDGGSWFCEWQKYTNKHIIDRFEYEDSKLVDRLHKQKCNYIQGK